MLKKISIDEEACIHCGLCIQDCVVGCIAFDENEIPHYISEKKEYCVGCQHCMSICPTGAFAFGDKKPQNAFPVSYGKSEDLLRLIQSRRSVRFYKNDDISNDLIQKLTTMLPYIPTGGNADNLHFSLLVTREKMNKIRKATYDEIVCQEDPSGMLLNAKNAFQRGNDVIYREATAMVAVAIDKEKTIPGCETADPIIALSYFELYAQSLGLGTLWCDYAVTVLNQLPKAYSLLEIPSNYTLAYTLLFGIPSVTYARTIQPDMFSVKILR